MPRTPLKVLLSTLFCLALVGCPGEKRIYIHNGSNSTLSSDYALTNARQVHIPPGRTKYVLLLDWSKLCIPLRVDGRAVAFEMPMNVLTQSREKRYGSRLDLYFSEEGLYYRSKSGSQTRLNEVASCGGDSVAAVLAFAAPLLASATGALLEVDGVFGECRAELGAVDDSLTLHKEPRRSAATRTIPYKKGWEVLYTKREGKTQILELGVIRVRKLGARYDCREGERAAFDRLKVGDTIEYLHYLGEGYARVRVDGTVCDTDLEDRSEYLEVLEQPRIDVWIRVLYEDGSSPGWLLNDNTQTRVAGVAC